MLKKKSFVGKNAKKPKTSFRFWAFLFLFLGIAASGFFLAISSYEKTIKKNELGETISISAQQKAKFLADSLKLTQCVQYALLAEKNAWYEKCNGSGKVFLYRGEFWKYGITCEKTVSFKVYCKPNVSQENAKTVMASSGQWERYRKEANKYEN